MLPLCLVQAAGEIPEDVLETQVDPAAFEICGHIVLKRDIDYETVTQVRAWQPALRRERVLQSYSRWPAAWPEAIPEEHVATRSSQCSPGADQPPSCPERRQISR